MALYTDLPIYRDTYQLILKVFEYTKEFAKEYKYTLGQDMFVLNRSFRCLLRMPRGPKNPCYNAVIDNKLLTFDDKH